MWEHLNNLEQPLLTESLEQIIIIIDVEMSIDYKGFHFDVFKKQLQSNVCMKFRAFQYAQA